MRTVKRTGNTNTQGMFLTVIEGMVYTLGALFSAAGLYIALRWYNGQPLPFLQAFDSSALGGTDLENAQMRRMEITPDVIRT